MMNNSYFSFSKSKYCGFRQCPKMAWLRKYKPDLLPEDDMSQSRMESGSEVGKLARGLFGEYVDVTVFNDEYPDVSKMISRTNEELEKGTPVICEASFKFERLYCAVDILRKEADGWSIYEVKSSTKADKDIYYADVAYQKYVLEQCGMHVSGCFLVVINNEYVFDGTLDISQLFNVVDVSSAIKEEEDIVSDNILRAKEILLSDKEPEIDISEHCSDSIGCDFWSYCTRALPKPSVFDLYRLNKKKKFEYYRQGLIRYEDLINLPNMNNIRMRQMEYYLYDKGDYVDSDKIKEFLDTLYYPLYFLDFETIQPVIPMYVGTKPYQQITFQYSLHYIEHEGGELKHKEFLAEAGEDPRRPLAERLCTDIPTNACVTAYNKKFECGRIKELAETFPDLADHLYIIESNIVDLLKPFQSGCYYNKAMGGSFSIKSVLPALFPDDPELDYHALEGVHNGSEAMTVFPKLIDMSPEEQAETRKNLLAYCKLDTLAMVKVWEKLCEVERS